MLDIDNLSIKNLVECGAHFGHKRSFWNPKMLPYIYGSTSSGVHIIDLSRTYSMFKYALAHINKVAKDKGRILFVGTKMQASELIEEAATRCAQYFINHTWRGGMLTNWSTVSVSMNRLAEYEKILADLDTCLTKKELSGIDKKRMKLDRVFKGIRNMGGLPDLIFVIDTRKEHIVIKEASKLGIPIVAIVDTNSDPKGIDYPIPGNDDSTKSIEYYCRLVSNAVLSGIEMDMQANVEAVSKNGNIILQQTDDAAVTSENTGGDVSISGEAPKLELEPNKDDNNGTEFNEGK